MVTAACCAKMADPIQMLFGIWTLVGPWKHALDRGGHRRHLANTVKPSVCGGDAACCQITLTACLFCVCIS